MAMMIHLYCCVNKSFFNQLGRMHCLCWQWHRIGEDGGGGFTVLWKTIVLLGNCSKMKCRVMKDKESHGFLCPMVFLLSAKDHSITDVSTL
jgi:hypothetical protein